VERERMEKLHATANCDPGIVTDGCLKSA